MANPKKFVALLRGINVGGHKKVPMAELRTAFEKWGFTNVKTLLASGNVVFEGSQSDTKKIESNLEQHFGFEISTIIIPFEDVEKIVNSDPFKGIEVTKNIHLYITFLKDKPTSKLEIPYTSDDKSFTILKKTDHAVLSILDIDKRGTVDAMKILEQEFGKNITTRNYNTVVKISQITS